ARQLGFVVHRHGINAHAISEHLHRFGDAGNDQAAVGRIDGHGVWADHPFETARTDVDLALKGFDAEPGFAALVSIGARSKPRPLDFEALRAAHERLVGRIDLHRQGSYRRYAGPLVASSPPGGPCACRCARSPASVTGDAGSSWASGSRR